MNRVVAVDGPAASGKGTLARRLARHYGFAHLDSGRLYRAVALRVIREAIDPNDEKACSSAAATLDLAHLDDPALRSEAAGRMASRVSAHPRVRRALLDFQRRFAATPPGAVIDGRDIGTVICPDAPAKLFVTATVEERARRRHKELLDQGEAAIYAAVLKDLADRDARDTSRATAPLVRAADAFLLDTTSMDVEAAFAAALAYVESRIGPAKAGAGLETAARNAQ
ncbi:MAG: (d)CMP kinase [Alphaproteobacteria bacterium]|nr:(d)CMP kinase [Alphaproteobacteria bacterium]